MANSELTRRRLFFYSLPEMPLQVAAIPVMTIIPNYYGSELGVSLATVGTVWLLEKRRARRTAATG